jgi:tetratricopeptide (TPR) repeat protein
MEAVNKALSIDPKLSDAYTSLCENRFAYELNFPAAESDCKRAIELDRNSSPAHRLYSILLTSRGRSDEAFVEINTAMELEPSSLRNQRIFANDLYFARRYEEAIPVYQRLLDLNPEASMTHLYFIRSLERAGRESDAFDVLIKLLILQKKDDATIERFRAAYASAGWHGVVNERIQTELQEKSPQYSVIAEYYGLLGDKDRAFEYLEKNFQKRGWMKMFLRVDPRFDPIRDDPRFEDLLRRVEKSQI